MSEQTEGESADCCERSTRLPAVQVTCERMTFPGRPETVEGLNMLVVRIAQELQSDIPTSFSAWRAKVENEVLI